MKNVALLTPNTQSCSVAITQIPFCFSTRPSEVQRSVNPAELRGAQGISARELQVLIGVAQGETNKQIALRLELSRRTVETYRTRVMRKLKIRSVAGLTQFAFSQGWMTLPNELFDEAATSDNRAILQDRAA
jgi:Response regulator containing a CheY-like receiver domain and an HTH DNA-binding domain